MLLSKFAPYLVVGLIFSLATLFVDKRFFEKEQEPCPDCICDCPEPPTVSVQPFEVDKIKGLRSFQYSPQFSGHISVAGVDSASVRKMITESVDAAFKKYYRK